MGESHRHRLAVTGPGLLVLGICVNEWVTALILGRELSLSTRVGIWLINILLVLTGGVFWYFRIRIPLRTIAINAILFGILVSLLEGVFIALLNINIPLPAEAYPEMVRILYMENRDIIQFTRECARYDAELGYTLRPGSCTFSGVEFSNRLDINRLGLRDDERSLRSPEIIVIGDSHAMGWGVEQHDTFPDLIEQRIGITVLNAAVSSYGTVREIQMLGRLDVSNLKALIIQYCQNDFSENAAYRKNGDKLATMSRERYFEIVEQRESGAPYVFGEHIHRLVKHQVVKPFLELAARPFRSNEKTLPETKKLEERSPVDAFLYVLGTADLLRLGPIPILVVEINGRGIGGTDFISELGSRVGDPEGTPGPGIEPLELGEKLGAEHYYRLDDHLNRHGHEVVAEAILERLQQLGIE